MKPKVFFILTFLLFTFTLFVGCGQVSHLLKTITVTPPSASLIIGGKQSFTAVGRDEGDNIVSFTPSWYVEPTTIGTVSATGNPGVFTASATGEGKVVAYSGDISGYATVTVTTGELASILVTPNPASLFTWQQHQFTATGKNSQGGTVPISPTWSVIGGMGIIDTNGLFTATKEGTGSVEASTSYLGTTITGTASVTVTATTTQTDYNAIYCVYVSSAEPGSCFGAVTPVKCGYDTTNGSQYITYYKFDLSAIPPSAEVTSAIFHFYVEERVPSDQSVDVIIKNVTSSWNEGISFNTKPSSGEVIIPQYTVANVGDNQISESAMLTQVRNWVNGTVTNYGFQMEPYAVALKYVKISGRITAFSERKPRLTITHKF